MSFGFPRENGRSWKSGEQLKLISIHLENFRNYATQDIEFGEGVNILYGDNAQGKTNVVEAVHLLATGKSHRTRHLADMVRHGAERFRIEAVIQDDDRQTSLVLAYDRRKGKQLLVNDIGRPRWSDLLGMLHVLMFSPETMDVVKGGPAERRRFLDILLCQLDARYLRCLQQYTALLRQKSAALRDRSAQDRYADLMPVWNEGMAKNGAYLAWKRMETARRMEQLANRELNVLSGGRESLVLTLQTCIATDHSLDTKAIGEHLLGKLQHMLAREREAGQCLAGVHRDEMQISLNENAARVFSSQGQQRSIALSLILAAMYLYRENAGALPVLLLDDVMSELDPMRQTHLIQVLEKTQTLITTTDRQEYGSRMPADTKWFEVCDGKLSLR